MLPAKNTLDATSEKIINFLIHNGKDLKSMIALNLATISFDDISDEVLMEIILEASQN
jgi:hypothetical protein